MDFRLKHLESSNPHFQAGEDLFSKLPPELLNLICQYLRASEIVKLILGSNQRTRYKVTSAGSGVQFLICDQLTSFYLRFRNLIHLEIKLDDSKRSGPWFTNKCLQALPRTLQNVHFTFPLAELCWLKRKKDPTSLIDIASYFPDIHTIYLKSRTTAWNDETIARLPSSITDLSLPDNGHITNEGISHLPPSIVRLGLKALYNRENEGHRWPPNLTCLAIGQLFTKTVLAHDLLPRSLKELKLNTSPSSAFFSIKLTTCYHSLLCLDLTVNQSSHLTDLPSSLTHFRFIVEGAKVLRCKLPSKLKYFESNITMYDPPNDEEYGVDDIEEYVPKDIILILRKESLKRKFAKSKRFSWIPQSVTALHLTHWLHGYSGSVIQASILDMLHFHYENEHKRSLSTEEFSSSPSSPISTSSAPKSIKDDPLDEYGESDNEETIQDAHMFWDFQDEPPEDCDVNRYLAMPRELIELSIKFENIDHFSGRVALLMPRNLRTLRIFGDVSSDSIQHLPPNLTHLYISKVIPNMKSPIFRKLAILSEETIHNAIFATLNRKCLKHLSLGTSVEFRLSEDTKVLEQARSIACQSSIARGIPFDSCIAYLPPNLTHLEIQNNKSWNESILEGLPLTIHTLILPQNHNFKTSETFFNQILVPGRFRKLRLAHLSMVKHALKVLIPVSIVNDSKNSLRILKKIVPSSKSHNDQDMGSCPSFDSTSNVLSIATLKSAFWERLNFLDHTFSMSISISSSDWVEHLFGPLPSNENHDSDSGCSSSPAWSDDEQGIPVMTLDFQHCCRFNPAVLQLLPNSITHLFIDFVHLIQITDFIFPPTLMTLSISTVAEIRCAKFLPPLLTHLSLPFNQFEDDQIQHLSRSLKYLNIQFNEQVTDDGMKSLPPLLTYLNISGNCMITTKCIKSLPKSIVHLDMVAMCTEGLEWSELPRKLEFLNLSWNAELLQQAYLHLRYLSPNMIPISTRRLFSSDLKRKRLKVAKAVLLE